MQLEKIELFSFFLFWLKQSILLDAILKINIHFFYLCKMFEFHPEIKSNLELHIFESVEFSLNYAKSKYKSCSQKYL